MQEVLDQISAAFASFIAFFEDIFGQIQTALGL